MKPRCGTGKEGAEERKRERERGAEKARVKGSYAAPRSILRHCDTAAPRTSISLKAFKEAERAPLSPLQTSNVLAKTAD